MRGTASASAASLESARRGLVERLSARKVEIEQAIMDRARVVAPLTGAGDSEYLAGLRCAVGALVDLDLAAMEHGDAWSAPIPSAALMQARRAARNGVGLETILLRCAAGQRIMSHFVMGEAHDFPREALRRVLDMQGLLFERLVQAISTEYTGEMQRTGRSRAQRHAALVRGLLVGEPLDTAQLSYAFDAWHVGVIATGGAARETLGELAAAANRQPLFAFHAEDTVWGWLGGTRSLPRPELARAVQDSLNDGVSLAVGQEARGIDGWRLTHRQAQDARLVALHRPRTITWYADEMLLAAALRDETLARSLKDAYVSPLARQGDRGAVARATLQAYFTAQRNMASTAAALHVVRGTVESRLAVIEVVIGRPLADCMPELEVAMRLDELDVHDTGDSALPEMS
jgi:DNA-binding PucR family transcriptional regulator